MELFSASEVSSIARYIHHGQGGTIAVGWTEYLEPPVGQRLRVGHSFEGRRDVATLSKKGSRSPVAKAGHLRQARSGSDNMALQVVGEGIAICSEIPATTEERIT